jgi:solute carrier family 25 (mitochondrial citrate transporter), member 1
MLQLQDQKNPKYNGILDCLRKTIKTNGFFGLYTGLSSLFYFAIPKVSFFFLIFFRMLFVLLLMNIVKIS